LLDQAEVSLDATIRYHGSLTGSGILRESCDLAVSNDKACNHDQVLFIREVFIHVPDDFLPIANFQGGILGIRQFLADRFRRVSGPNMSSITWTMPVTFLASPNTAISLASSIQVFYATRSIPRTMSDRFGIPQIKDNHSGVHRLQLVALRPLYLPQRCANFDYLLNIQIHGNSTVHAKALFYLQGSIST